MRDRRPSLLAVILLGALAAWIAVAGLGGGEKVHAEDAKRVATSVCEAHELEELQKKDPGLQIEIPDEFKTMFPTRAACLSHAAAEDPDAPGPVQPIQFSHKHHAGLYQIDC